MAPIQYIFGYSYLHNTRNLPQNSCVRVNSTFSFFTALILFFPFVRMYTSLTMFQVIHPPPQKITLACIACLCFYSTATSEGVSRVLACYIQGITRGNTWGRWEQISPIVLHQEHYSWFLQVQGKARDIKISSRSGNIHL